MSDEIGMARLMSDVGDVVAILGANIEARAQREGRYVDKSDVGMVVQALLTTAYCMARDRVIGDQAAGVSLYLDLLRNHVSDVERSLAN